MDLSVLLFLSWIVIGLMIAARWPARIRFDYPLDAWEHWLIVALEALLWPAFAVLKAGRG